MSGRRRCALLACLAVVLLVIAGVVAWRARPVSPAPGFALVPGTGNPSSPHAAEVTLRAELTSQSLHYTNVYCVKNGRVFRGEPIIRCNVDFGDPHIVAYCTVVQAGRLITNFQNHAIPCGADLAGSKPILLP